MNQFEELVFQRLLGRAKASKHGRVTTASTLRWLSDVFPDPIELRKALNALRAAGKLTFTCGSRGEPVSAYITVHAPEASPAAHMQLWQAVIGALDVCEEERAVLAPLGVGLEGFQETHMRELLLCLYALRTEQDCMAGRALFEVSAAFLLGSSKLLSSLDARCLRHFGIKVTEFSPRPSYLLVANAPSPVAVIFVENPVAFELASTSAAAKTCTFVCTFGFGLSTAGNEHGYQLASIVNANQAIVLHRTPGPQTDLATLIAHPNVQFWGDLDQAGMQIFERLAQRIPHIQLSALYQPMLHAIDAPARRHPYALATGKDGQALYVPLREDARLVAALCVDYAVDQEIVPVSLIEAFAGKILSLS